MDISDCEFKGKLPNDCKFVGSYSVITPYWLVNTFRRSVWPLL